VFKFYNFGHVYLSFCVDCFIDRNFKIVPQSICKFLINDLALCYMLKPINVLFMLLVIHYVRCTKSHKKLDSFFYAYVVNCGLHSLYFTQYGLNLIVLF